MGKVSLSRSVSILALTAGLLSSVSSGHTTIYWQGQNPNWQADNNWAGNAAPQQGDTAGFNNNNTYTKNIGGDGSSALIAAHSVKKIIFDSGAPAYTIHFYSGQDVGSSQVTTVSFGGAPVGTETLYLPSARMRGNFGSSDYTSSLQLNFSGISSILTDGSSINYYAHMSFGGSVIDVTTISSGGAINIHGPITGGGKLIVDSTPLTLSNPGSNHSLKIDINSGGSLTMPAGDSYSTSFIRMENGTLVFSDSTSSADYKGNIVLASPAESNTISIPNSGTSVTILRPITDSNSGNGFTLSAGTLILGGTTRSTYTGGTAINNGTLKTPSTKLPDSGDISLTAGGTLEFTDQDSSNYDQNINGSCGTTNIITMAGTGTLTLGGTVSGNVGVTVNSGTLILEGPAGNYYGPTTIASGANLTLSSIDSNSMGESFTISGGGFDISDFKDISTQNQPYPLQDFTAESGSTLTISINNLGYSTNFDLDNNSNPVNLDHLTLNIKAVTGDYTDSTSGYLLFDNASGTTFSGTLHAINLTSNLTDQGFIAALVEPITAGASQVKFKLSKSPAVSPTTEGAKNSVRAHETAHHTSTAINKLSGVTLVEARTYAEENSSRSGGSEIPTGNFTRNPLKAPDISRDFLNVTQGAMMTESKENAQRWSPARTEKTGVWVLPFGMTLRQVTNGTATGYNTRTGGVLAGFDHKVRYDVILGAGLGYAQTKLNFDSNQGKMGIKDKFLTFFGTWFRGPWYLEASILMGLEKYQGSRNTGINNQFALNHHDGYQLTPKIGGGYTFDVKGSKLKTYATFDYTYSTQYGYQETGAANTYWNKSRASMLRSEVGLNLTQIYEYKDFSWKPGFTLGVVNKKPIKKGKIISPSAGSFESTTVTTTDISPGVESTWQFNDGYALSASWTGEFGSQYNLQEASVKFTKKF